jgi:DNA-binding PadR family transcriptional regulator
VEVNATAAALLGLLRDGPHTGYALAQQAQQELGDFWTVTRSQVYRELAAMAARGLVRGDETGARNARAYHLTDAGRAAFSAWLHAEPGPDVVRIPLLLRLAFVEELEPARLREVVVAQRDEHAARLAGYEQIEAAARAAGAPDRQLLTLRFGLAYERAVLGWFDGLPEL